MKAHTYSRKSRDTRKFLWIFDCENQPFPLWHTDTIHSDEEEHHDVDAYNYSVGDRQFIPQVPLHGSDGLVRKRVLVLCTGGTLTMAPGHRYMYRYFFLPEESLQKERQLKVLFTGANSFVGQKRRLYMVPSQQILVEEDRGLS